VQNVVLSHLQAQEILTAAEKEKQTTAVVSLDLGLSSDTVVIEREGVYLPDGKMLTFEELEFICKSERGCFVIDDEGAQKIQVFSESTNKIYSLMPTHGAPTLLISGIAMHRIKGVDPYEDTVEKIKSVAPITGSVLDTTTGLGYTAIEAAKTADQVITIELDPACLEIARLNPWSQALFDHPKITRIIGDSLEEIQEFDDKQFARIIHDPPVFSLAGELYSTQFYRQAWRVLQAKGRLFHYIGSLDSKSRQNNAVAKGAMRRLQEAGFSRVVRRARAFGVVAYK
jgi:predicted methyltransferase